MKYNKFKGTGVAIVTPFLEDDNIDFESLSKLVNHIITNNTDYIVALGTTAETPTLTEEEKDKITAFVIRENAGKLPVVVGMSSNNTLSLVNKIKKTDFTGIDAILSVCPYYNKPNQEGIFRHFESVSAVSPVPVIAYNVPGRTGGGINAQTTIKMAKELKNIIGIKEASGNINQIMKIIEQKPDDFLVISGDDALTLPVIATGGVGVISVVANAFPCEVTTMVNYCLHNDFESARPLHYKLLELVESLFADGSPAGVKVALETLGICKNILRLPLTKVNEQLEEKIKRLTIKILSEK